MLPSTLQQTAAQLTPHYSGSSHSGHAQRHGEDSVYITEQFSSNRALSRAPNSPTAIIQGSGCDCDVAAKFASSARLMERMTHACCRWLSLIMKGIHRGANAAASSRFESK